MLVYPHDAGFTAMFVNSLVFTALSHSVCLNHGSWSQGRVGSPIFGSSLLSSERNIHETSKRGNTRRCPTPNAHPLSLLSWRCLQWERPNALLEERERFIKDWRDCALSVFYWRLPAFLWASLLQQHWYVRQESGDTLRCIHFENSQSAPDPYSFSKYEQFNILENTHYIKRFDTTLTIVFYGDAASSWLTCPSLWKQLNRQRLQNPITSICTVYQWTHYSHFQS